MKEIALSAELRNQALRWQKEEITGYHTYRKLQRSLKDNHNRQVIGRIADEEMRHYETLRHYTARDIAPNHFRVMIYAWLARIAGLTFGLKLMERSEEKAQASYTDFLEEFPELRQILHEEEEHETQLLNMLDEDVLKYTGSVVLGLNDALVELTGTLAGLTFAFQNTNLIALSGLITGLSASLSMAASEYLSARADEGEIHPGRSALYTGLAYVFTVTVLVFPYLLLENYLLSLGWTLLNAVLVIAVFNAYLSVARDLSFIKRFGEMALISIGVAALSFGIGFLIRTLFGFEV
jgi:vacuolar iron transporter family protein